MPIEGIHVNISDLLAETPVSDLDLSRHVTVTPDASVTTTVHSMSAVARSCAHVMTGANLAGIFTQRDVLHRVLGRPSIWERPISEEMTTSVRTMRDTQTVAEGLAIMNEWYVRSVPVLDVNDVVVGDLSYYVVMETIAGIISERRGDPSADPDINQLEFIDFTGMNTSPAVVVAAGDTVDVAVHQMKARGIGSVMVVDDREDLVGVLTEFDAQLKLGCDESDLKAVTVSEIMTAEPVALKVRSSITDAIQKMVEHGFSHVPLLGESGRPVAVVSFRDVAAYLESSLATL